MIRYVDDIMQTVLSTLVSQDNIYACRIACLLKSYGIGYPFLSFYIQTDENGNAVSAVSEYYSDMTVMLTQDSDIAELVQFLEMRGFSSVLSEKKLFPELPCEEGVVMRLENRERLLNARCHDKLILNIQPDPGKIWRLLKSCEDESFHVPEYEDFLPDMSHKIRHGTALCASAEYQSRTVGTAMTVAQSESCAVIGAVCASKELQRTGIGSFCMRELCCRLGGRTIYIMRSRDENEGFYSSLGFENRESFYITKR